MPCCLPPGRGQCCLSRPWRWSPYRWWGFLLSSPGWAPGLWFLQVEPSQNLSLLILLHLQAQFENIWFFRQSRLKTSKHQIRIFVFFANVFQKTKNMEEWKIPPLWQLGRMLGQKGPLRSSAWAEGLHPPPTHMKIKCKPRPIWPGQLGLADMRLTCGGSWPSCTWLIALTWAAAQQQRSSTTKPWVDERNQPAPSPKTGAPAGLGVFQGFLTRSLKSGATWRNQMEAGTFVRCLALVFSLSKFSDFHVCVWCLLLC